MSDPTPPARSPRASTLEERLAVRIIQRHEQELDRLRTQVERLTAELAEADRRAGEAERKRFHDSEKLATNEKWIRRAKEEAGYHDSVSFDVVWVETRQRAEAAEARAERYRSIVAEVAAGDPQTSAADEEPTCHYCNCYYEREEPEFETVLLHAEDCLWVRAGALTEGASRA